MESSREPVVYRIGSNDIIEYMNKSWYRFAIDNEAPALSACVLGTSLWDHIAGEEVQQIYQELLRSVRQAMRTISIPFRCDSPQKYRVMRLKIIPHPQGRIEFQALLEEEGDHEHYLALLKRSAVRNPSDTVFMCSMCRAVRIDEKWRPIEAAAQELQLLVRETTPRITHVLCENCRFISRQATRRA